MKKIPISQLPLGATLKGLFTLGTDANNNSVKVSLTFVQESADNCVKATNEAKQATTDAVNATNAANKATTDAITAETARKNSWTAWFENATTGVKAIWSKWFGDTKTNWNSFNSIANQAETARVNDYASLRSDIIAKTNEANSAAAYANEIADHQPIIGEDGYWYRWDAVNDVYVKTDDYAKGGADYPVFGLDVETMNVTVDAVISNDRYAVTDDGILVVLF